MVVSNIQQYNYNTVSNTAPVKSGMLQKQTLKTAAAPVSNSITFQSSQKTSNLRTELFSDDEKKKYTELLKTVDKNSKRQLELLLKSGVLLNADSNDRSTVLDNLYKIATTPRAEGLDAQGLLKDTISTISYPFLVTQQFGDIPEAYRARAIAANTAGKTNLLDRYISYKDIDVEHSGTCVAASIEFNLAEKMPAEFARFAEGLSSADMSVKKEIKLNNLADNPLDAIWLLNAFEIPFEASSFDSALLTFAPDKNAILRAQIQTTNRDPLER